MILDGDVYAHGLGVHAPSEVAYELNPSLRAVRGAGRGRGARKLAGERRRQGLSGRNARRESPLLRAGDAPWNVDVTIPRRLRSGATPRRLRLVITDGGNGINSDWCDWVNAGFITRKNR